MCNMRARDDIQSQEPDAERIEWIDVLKGMGIIIVVVGHVWVEPRRLIFWFHMPLFFFISGRLFRSPLSWLGYARKKTARLLAPYLCFLVLLSIPEALRWFSGLTADPPSTTPGAVMVRVGQILYGGRYLTDSCGVFWFITSLLICQLAYAFLHTRFGGSWWKLAAIVVGLYLLAVFDGAYLPSVRYPLAAGPAALAIVFFWAGNTSAMRRYPRAPVAVCAGAVLVGVVLLELFTDTRLMFNMKYKDYGAPVLSIAVALSCIVLLIELARFAALLHDLNSALRALGRASLVIMFLHQPVQLTLANFQVTNSPAVRIIAGVLVPFLAFLLFRHYSLTRRYLLGDYRSQARASDRADGNPLAGGATIETTG